METRKSKLLRDAQTGNYGKIILGIRMPDGTKEVIINDDATNKVDYIKTKYDDDLRMYGAPIQIEEYLLIKI